MPDQASWTRCCERTSELYRLKRNSIARPTRAIRMSDSHAGDMQPCFLKDRLETAESFTLSKPYAGIHERRITRDFPIDRTGSSRRPGITDRCVTALTDLRLLRLRRAFTSVSNQPM